MLFTAVYKRVYRSLSKEFKKLYRLNSIYLDPKEETNILDDQIGQQDFEEDTYDVCPAADPAATSSQEKQAKAQMLLSLIQLGTVDPMAVTLRLLEAQEQPRPQELLPKGPPPPDPKTQAIQAKSQADAQLAETKKQAMEQKMQQDAQHAMLEQRSKEFELTMKAQMAEQDRQHTQAMGALKLQLETIQGQLSVATAAQTHQQKMKQNQEAHQQKMSQQPKKGVNDK